MPNEVIGPLSQFGMSGALIAALLWFLHSLLTKTIPQIQAQFGEQLNSERELFREEMTMARQRGDDGINKLFAEIRSVGHVCKEISDLGCMQKIVDRQDHIRAAGTRPVGVLKTDERREQRDEQR